MPEPSLSTVHYNGSEIRAHFTYDVPGWSTFQIALFEGTNTKPTQTAKSGPDLAILPNPQMNLTSVWTVRIAAVTGQSPVDYGNAIEVIVGPPQNVVLNYDGEALKLNWQPPAGATHVTGAMLSLYANGEFVADTTFEAQPGVYRLPGGLLPGVPYTVKLGGTNRRHTSLGPSPEPIEVIQQQALFSKATYTTDGKPKLVAKSSTTSQAHRLGLYLHADGLLSKTTIAPAPGDVVQMDFDSPLDPAFIWTASLAYTIEGGGTRGPLSVPVSLIVEPANITAITYDGTTVSASWDNGVGWPSPTGADVTIRDAQGQTVGSANTLGTNVSIAPDPPLTPNTPYSLVVQANRGISSGPVSGGVAVLTYVATPTAVSYDGETIGVAWENVGASEVKGILVALLDNGAVVQTQPGGTLKANMPAAVTPNGTYDIKLQTTGDRTTGPLGTAVPVISFVPRVTGATYVKSASTNSVEVKWTASSAHGVTGYKVQLYENGAALGNPVSVAGATTDQVTVNLESVLDTSKTHTVTVQATGDKSTGSLSMPGPIITASPQFVSVHYNATNVTAEWSAVGQDGVSGYKVTVDNTTQTTSLTSITFAFTPSSVNPPISVIALGATATGPPASTTLLTAQVAVKSTSYDGSILKTTWLAPTPAPAYLVEVLVGTNAVASQMTTALQAALPVALSRSDSYSVAVSPASADAIVIGPRSATAPTIVQAPTIASIAFDTSGSLKIDWDAISGAGRYKVQFSIANKVVLEKNPATNSLTLAASELPPSGIYNVTVQPFASAENDDVSGPLSAALPAVVQAPHNVRVAYDGRTARVTWEPLTSQAIAGYITTILNGATPVSSATTVGPAASIDVAYAATNNYNVVVQALTGAGAGQPSAPAALFQAGWYPSTATNASSNIIPASAAAMSNYDIEVYLPNIFTTFVSTGLPTDPPFVFSTASAPYSYKLTMPANSAVWNFTADSIRSNIDAAYKTLLTKLIQLKVTPLGWRMVQDAISRAMPQTFAETLYYGYGFVPSEGYIDLKPGMLLRVDFESYQYLGPDQPVSSYLNGFVNSSSAFYDVGSYVSSGDQWLTGFDAFLSLVTQSGSTVPTPQSKGSSTSGGGGIVDLYYAQFRKSYVRLVYPPQILKDTEAKAQPSFNVAVVASNDYQTLETATENLRNGLAPPEGAAATYLRGRTMISACIRVWLDGQALVVPVGTSVGNLLDNMGRRPPIVIPQSGTPGIPLSGIVVERSIGYAVTDPNGYSASKAIPIRLDWNKGMAYSATTDWLSLPLLPGDHIITRGNE